MRPTDGRGIQITPDGVGNFGVGDFDAGDFGAGNMESLAAKATGVDSSTTPSLSATRLRGSSANVIVGIIRSS
ncbi:hypothetical protein [Brevibacterium sp. ZH18]|uniref:hypothetical protein n=1 Tax=Brevibacterium sp. ZH18 TaxID=2927784 RepID=UPI001F61AE88|nr:hypothetical protein [Brevibacterium sp. ZH18]MCI4010056.1 hypothetical protein [Brevibacterium sp. ZH18]